MSRNTPQWNEIQKDIETTVRNHGKRMRRQRLAVLIAGVLIVAAAVLGFVVASSPQSDAVSQVTINKYIREHGGIPPCTHEDGSRQPGVCYWDASEHGKGKGDDGVNVSRKNNDDRWVKIQDHTPNR